eukprot:g4745.t1
MSKRQLHTVEERRADKKRQGQLWEVVAVVVTDMSKRQLHTVEERRADKKKFKEKARAALVANVSPIKLNENVITWPTATGATRGEDLLHKINMPDKLPMPDKAIGSIATDSSVDLVDKTKYSARTPQSPSRSDGFWAGSSELLCKSRGAGHVAATAEIGREIGPGSDMAAAQRPVADMRETLQPVGDMAVTVARQQPPKVAVGVRAVESVLATQYEQMVEMIVVDDGSKDRTREILNEIVLERERMSEMSTATKTYFFANNFIKSPNGKIFQNFLVTACYQVIRRELSGNPARVRVIRRELSGNPARVTG